MEALSAGLGLVLSTYATANLDTDLPFISVIPEDRLHNMGYVESIIKKNRESSLEHRLEIREYAKEFDWSNTINRYLLPSIERVITGMN